ncbi:hypothetical protein OG894_00810 [Streptomyces sp. NBC_01724]|uniref:hypothetical protein n=1 Tax=unclassified Streptomyces TaxID=2593676 RepID=UPI002E352C84|nr:hypothetical protein [Streptomyces sp. NBC_01724]WTE56625.1 hypothetical protein OG987_41835 [Streptomyces sp. NBC_01620]WTE64698.1 hypothetical protein OG784_41570 [Streptomyces sp. NBC_01617]WTI91987.1 hypothetical protein OHB17_40895 [Streptomyces sp. NBC_00724]
MFLDERAERRRIPPAAIEEVRAAGRHRRTAEIVLTAAQGPANVHAVTHHRVEAGRRGVHRRRQLHADATNSAVVKLR